MATDRGPSSLARISAAATELTRVRRCHRLAQGIQQQVAQPRQVAAQDHQGRVHEVQGAGHGPAQVHRGLASHLQGQGIARQGRVLDLAGGWAPARQGAVGVLGGQFAHAIDQGLRAHEGDQAALQAADAGLAVGVDGDVADLAGDPRGAPVDLAADDVPRAHARGDLDVDEVVDVAARAPPVLGQGAQVGVVVHQQGHAEPGGQAVQAQALLPGGQHHAGQAVRMSRVHGRGHRHADAQQRLALPPRGRPGTGRTVRRRACGCPRGRRAPGAPATPRSGRGRAGR